MRRLLALSLAVLLLPIPLWAAEGGNLVEVGVGSVSISDENARVNEYSTVAPDEETVATGKLKLSSSQGGVYLDLAGEASGGKDQAAHGSLDINRIIRVRTSFDRFQHQLDNDQMNYLNAAVPDGSLYNSANPLGPNNIPGAITAYNSTTGLVTAAPPGPGTQQIGRAGLYGENFVADEDFYIDHKEFKAGVDLALVPGLTLHLGSRVESRDGFEQSIGMSKCTTCHITGQSKKVAEETRDVTFGATGKFGLLSVDYSYLDREFRDDAQDPTRVYDPALSPSSGTSYSPTNGTFDNRLLYDYEDGALPYDLTPESTKQSHVLKAKLDLARNTSLAGSYVYSQVESQKADEPGIFTLGDQLLKTTYDAYGAKLSTKLGKRVSLSLRAKVEELENEDAVITFEPMGTVAQPNLGGGALPGTIAATRESVITRDVLTLGVDGLIRLAKYTTLRLGYEFEENDREDAHFGETKTHTVKAKLKTRPTRSTRLWLGYTYQNIDNPFHNPHAAEYVDPVTGLPYNDKDGVAGTWAPGYVIGNGPLYGTAYYDERGTDLSSLPEDVHEGKVSFTWSPSVAFSTTASFRMKLEENNLHKSTWEQETINPALSFWYAPSQKLNLTFAYNYLGQSTESKFCQGWYDG